VFTGAGEVVTATADNEHADRFATFPNSYGSLGYATRLRIVLEPLAPTVALRHLRFDDLGLLAKTIAEITETRSWQGEPVDGLDGDVFEPGEAYLTLARWAEVDPTAGRTSDYTGQQIFYESIRERETDLLTGYDYLWRWDTDWFWCSGAFGLHDPRVRRLWPRRWKRSDVYYRLVGLDTRFGIMRRLDARAGRPQRERVIQDIEVPVDRLPEYLTWFDERVGMRRVWLCPLRLREPDGPGSARTWPSYPLTKGTTYVNVGFWGTVHVGDDAPQGPTNRAVEEQVHELGGHKSLYSTVHYPRDTFWRLYDGEAYGAAKRAYDPGARLPDLYDKCVR
jgi:FAD/FMN-containing dehydrogenase